MDTNNINISVLEQSYGTLQSEKSKFRNTTYSTFKSSYIYTCNDDLVRKLKKKLDDCYDHIEDEYRTITRWFEYYLDDVKNVDHGIINELNFINTHENAIQGYYSTHLSPLTFDYDKIHSTVQISTVVFPVSPVLNIGTNMSLEKNSLFSKNNYTTRVVIGDPNAVDKENKVSKTVEKDDFWGDVWEGVVDLVLWMGHGASQTVNGGADALPTMEYMENSYKSMMNTKKLVDLEDTAGALGLEKDTVVATVGTAGTSLLEGFAKAGEALVDFGYISGTAQYLYNTEGLTVEQQLARHEEAAQMWENTMSFVKEDHAGDAFNEFYENDATGKWLKDNAFAFDTVRAVGSGVGEVGTVVALQCVGIPAPLTAGMVGFGKGSETAWRNGASLEEGLLTGAATGVVDGVSYWAGGKMNNFNPFKSQTLNAFMHVAFDGVDGAANAAVQPAISLIYEDGYTDSNGQYHEYSNDFFTAYGEAFDAQGGWSNVLTGALLGIGMSSIGEVSGLAKHFRDNLEGKVNIDSDVPLNKDTANSLRNLLTDEYQAKLDKFLNNVTDIKNNRIASVKEQFDSLSSKFNDIKNAKDVNIKYDADTGKVYNNDAIDDASISAANYATAKGWTKEFRFTDADSMPDRNHPFWRDIQNSDKILINVGGRLMTFDDAISYKMNYDLNNIPETILDNNANSLKNEILSKISSDMSPLEQARKLYIELNSRIHYSMDWIKGDVSTKTSIYNQSISFDTLTSNDVICKGWSELYHELLISAGFDSNAVKIMGGSAVGAHKWIEVDLGNGQILVADATDVISHSIDLSNCKGGFKTNGFVLLDSTYSGIKLKQLSSEYLEWNNNNIMDIDLTLGYATKNGYYADIIKKSQNIFSDNEIVKKIFGNKIFEQKIQNFANTEIPVGMDGYEAYAYFNKIKHLLFDETELKQIKVSLLYNKTVSKIEGLTMISCLGDSSSYIIYSESLGKLTFCDLSEANNFLQTLNLVN